MRPPIPDTKAHVEVAAIAGSLRAGSWARSLLRATARRLPDHIVLNVWDGLHAVPLFNEDLESGPPPAAVAEMRHLVERSDALVIATPEYNQSIPGVMKNALDWASRPFGQSVLTGKPVAAVGTSPLPTGGASALSDVRKVLTILGADIVEADLTVAEVHTRIDAEGSFSDPDLALRVTRLVVNVATRAVTVGAVRAQRENETRSDVDVETLAARATA
jgi:chromate reductase